MDKSANNAGSAAASDSYLRRAATIGLWVLLMVAGFAVGWIASRLCRGGPPQPADREQLVGNPQAEDSDLPVIDTQPLQLVGLPLFVPNRDEMGAGRNEPKWDDPPAQEPVVSASDEVVPESQRWEIYFPSGITQPEYARQLAALGVELGVVRDDGTLEYLTNPGRPDPQLRTGRRSEEKRLYWTWSQGNLDKADKSLLKAAGVDVGEDVILHLWPPATSEKLAKLEREFKGRDVKEIYRTRFIVKRTVRGYEVQVKEQTAR